MNPMTLSLPDLEVADCLDGIEIVMLNDDNDEPAPPPVAAGAKPVA